MRKYILGLGLIILAIAGVGCSDFFEKSPPRETTRTALAITLPSELYFKPGEETGTSAGMEAAKITAIHLSVSADDIDTIDEDIPLDTLELTLDIPSGTARTFTLTLDTDPVKYYSGTTTVDLDPGANITVSITVVAVDITAAPTGLSATVGIVEVSLTWDSKTDATSYNIYWNETGSVTTSDSVITGITDTSYTHTGLTGDATYYYAISASNAAGESELSEEVSAIPKIFDETAPTTTASPVGGTIHYNPVVTLTCDDGAGVGCAKTFYTTDGTTPSTSSPLYSTPIYMSADTTLQFFSSDLRGNTESAKTETYTIDLPPTTTASPTGGAFNPSVNVTLTCADNSGTGCDTTYYTINGTEPTTASDVYSSPIAITTTKTLKFFSTDTSGESEAVVTETYTLDTTYPNVTSTYPNSNQVLIPTGLYGSPLPYFSATFSEEMNHSMIDTSTFSFSPPITGSITNAVISGATTSTFTPSTNLPGNTNFTGTISQTIKDLADNLLSLSSTAPPVFSDYTWNFKTGGWTYPAVVGDKINFSTTVAQSPQVAMGDNGSAIVVWVQDDNTANCGAGCNQVYASIFESGTWAHPASLSTPLSNVINQHASNLQVAMDNNGKATVVWQQSDGTDIRIYKNEYNAGWSGATPVSVSGSNASNPLVAMNDNGSTLIAWEQFDNTANCYAAACSQVYFSDRNITTPNAWTTLPTLGNYISITSQHAYNPQVAINNNEKAIITWRQTDGSTNCAATACNQMYKSDYNITSANTWTHPSGLADNFSPDNSHANDPRVAIDILNNVIITWSQNDSTTDCTSGTVPCSQVFISEYRSGTSTHPSSLTDNISPNGQFANAPQVAMGGNGDAIIVWTQTDGAFDQVFKSEYISGTWTHPSSIYNNISPDTQATMGPQVDMNDNGHAIITWYQSDGSTTQIYKSEYRGGTQKDPVDLSDSPVSLNGYQSTFPAVAIDSSGRTVITYLLDNAPTQVFIGEYR